MKSFLVVFISIISTVILYGQPDCGVLFKYKGIVESDSQQGYRIGFPSTRYMVGYAPASDSYSFHVYDIQDSSFEVAASSHHSSVFCDPVEFIIASVFKKLKQYPIRFYKKGEASKPFTVMREVLVPLGSIKFSKESFEDQEVIVMDLGTIRAE
jgi:hypothetical protein